MGDQDETREQPLEDPEVEGHGGQHLSPLGGGKNRESEDRDDEQGDDDVEGHGQHLSPLGGGKN